MTANTEGGAPGRASGYSTPRWATSPHSISMTGHERAMAATRDWLVEAQDPEGFWIGELEGDTILESEYVLLMAYLGRIDDPACVKMGRTILEEQNADGGWSIYPGGPPNISATVKAYFVLKMLGVPTDGPALTRAREVIHEHGGARACNSFTKFYLALLGQMPYDEVPYVPPELLLLPAKFPISLAAMSSWTRTIIVPLMIISVFKPVRKMPKEMGIAELFLDGPATSTVRHGMFSWENFFLKADRVMKWADRLVPASWRQPAVRSAHRWMLDHFENSDGLGAIFPPMIYTVVALGSLGYAPDSAAMTWALRQLEDLLIEEGETIRVQPCLSPTWDTAIGTIALADSGVPDYHPALLRSARWLLDKEVRVAGDWEARGVGAEPTGWHFQFHNERYPDIDDTAMVVLALHATALRDDPEVTAATKRAVNWLLALQNSDGGWAAYDRDINNQVLTKVTFADHNAILDPSCADITARVFEMLGKLGYRADHPAIARALEYIWRTQEPEGCWYGRWGVNYIYGTWQVLQGLKAIDFPMDHPAVVRACRWLESVQQADGGWGETCLSYDDPSYMGKGEPTPSQTAWAVLGLVSAGRASGEPARRGVEYLINTQKEDGTWFDETYTGTGFPRIFYLRYHLYPVSFSLMAVSRYHAAVGRLSTSHTGAQASRIPAAPRPIDI
ncbi:squalene--hopene cyclase [Tundrisphaera lichenicola]|uniref:squalene--hopene cyclase n=1 Tax=Tundrisphaera lichenicola TaxID=2029860 RepID=UPI003EB7701F